MKKAIIFDMDGVLIDSERLWQRAEREVFSSLGVKMDIDSCKITQTMTTTEVTKFWFSKCPWNSKDLKEVEQMVISRVLELIESENCGIDGVKESIENLKSKGMKIGLATNSPFEMIPKVLDKIGLTEYFDVTVSAEFEKEGKPAPDVYLTALQKLDEHAENCIAVEDSNTGILSAKKAGIPVIAFTNAKRNKNLKFADYIIDEYAELNIATFVNE